MTEQTLWVDLRSQNREFLFRWFFDLAKVRCKIKFEPRILPHPFFVRTSKDSCKLRTTLVVKSKERVWSNDPLRTMTVEFIFAPAIGTVHRNEINLLDQSAPIVMRNENIRRRNRHDIRCSNRAGTTERERAPFFAFNSDHVCRS